MEYLNEVILPYIRTVTKGLPARIRKKSQKVICIIDVFRGQMGEDFLSAMKEKDVLVAFVPAS